MSIAALLAAVASPLVVSTSWRRAIVALGFPLSVLATGAASPWLWLLPLGALVLVYPIGAWRDAPLFPTPKGSLDGLAAALPLQDGARILDAGCGTGDALLELAREYPRARILGIERSRPVALMARLRLGARATIARGDLWSGDWSSLDLVYVFQRPESMPRIAEKAAREMRADALLATLEFPVLGGEPAFTGTGTGTGTGPRTLFVYRAGDVRASPSAGPAGRAGRRRRPPARCGGRRSRVARRAPPRARAGRRRSGLPMPATP